MRTELKALLALLLAGGATAGAAVVLPWSAPATPSGAPLSSADLIERGRYLVKIAGCNDCHTAGYAPSAGNVPEDQWLTGDELGFRGPWGTTYPINLRLHLQAISEAQWLEYARTVQSRPPMPWFALRNMTEEDRRALYHYIRLLGPAGVAMPGFVPPGETPQGPYIQFPE